jgi:hypothetical protein
VARGDVPPQEALAAELAALPLALGAEGVMGPLRPTGGAPTGQIRWRAIKGGVLARLGQPRTRLGHGVTRLPHRRRVAVLGDREALRACLRILSCTACDTSRPLMFILATLSRSPYHDGRVPIHKKQHHPRPSEKRAPYAVLTSVYVLALSV